MMRMILAILLSACAVWALQKKKSNMILLCLVYYVGYLIECVCLNGAPIEIADFWGISYQIADIFLVVPAIDLFITLCKTPKKIFNQYHIGMIILTCMLVISMIVGIIQLGFNSKWVGDIRTMFRFIFLIFWFSINYEKGDLWKYKRWIDSVMLFILILACVVWIMDLGFGFRPFLSQVSGMDSDGGSSMRFIHAGAILIVAVYDLLLMRKDIETKGHIGMWTLILGIEIVLFQHRSVWLAWGMGIIMILISTYVEEKRHSRLTKQLLIGGGLGIAVMALGSGEIVQHFKSMWLVMFDTLKGNIDVRTTVGVRVAAWISDLETFSNSEWIFGRPFGSGYSKRWGEGMGTPHNGYIRMLERTGLIGLGIYLVIIIGVLLFCIKNRIHYVSECMICVLMFMMAYDYTWICGAVIGVGIMMRRTYSEQRVQLNENVENYHKIS